MQGTAMQRFFYFLVAATVWVGAERAEACGGLFCGNTPVDQTAERILFEVNDDNTTSAVIEIQYQGRAEDFSWVIPVPALWGVCTAENGEVEKALDVAACFTSYGEQQNSLFSLAQDFATKNQC